MESFKKTNIKSYKIILNLTGSQCRIYFINEKFLRLFTGCKNICRSIGGRIYNRIYRPEYQPRTVTDSRDESGKSLALMLACPSR